MIKCNTGKIMRMHDDDTFDVDYDVNQYYFQYDNQYVELFDKTEMLLMVPHTLIYQLKPLLIHGFKRARISNDSDNDDDNDNGDDDDKNNK